MGKHSRKDGEATSGKSNEVTQVSKPLLVDDKAVDPTLALLFASSVSFYRGFASFLLFTIY